MRILIADDDAVSRRLLQSYLEKWGHEVVTAENGAEAWERFQAGPFPIVISDWMMPGMDGPALVRRIRAAELPDYVFIILLTARAQKEDVVEGMEAGADDFVTKPFDRDELRVRLRAGERIVALERHVADHRRALEEAQAALAENEQLVKIAQLTRGLEQQLRDAVAACTAGAATSESSSAPCERCRALVVRLNTALEPLRQVLERLGPPPT